MIGDEAVSDFEIKTNAVLSFLNDFGEISQKIKRINDESNEVFSSLRSSISTKLSTRAIINSSLARCQASSKQMQAVLEDVCRIYNKVEQSIMDNKTHNEKKPNEPKIVPALPNMKKYDLINDFVDSRNMTRDAVLIGLTRSDLLEGVKSVINRELGRDDMNDRIYKRQLLSMIETTQKNTVDVELEEEYLDAIKKYAVDPVNGYNDICKLLEKNNETSKFFESFDSKSFDKLGKIAGYGTDGIDIIKKLFSDYSKTITSLEALKKGLQSVNGNETTIDYIDQLINDYNSKPNLVIDKVFEMVLDYGADKGLEYVSYSATGGLLGIANLLHGIIWNVSGLESKGDTLAELYASYLYSNDLCKAYENYAAKLKSGNYTKEEYDLCRNLFQMAKSTRIQEYTNILDHSNVQDHEYIEQQLKELNQLQWINSDRSDGSGDSAFMGSR